MLSTNWSILPWINKSLDVVAWMVSRAECGPLDDVWGRIAFAPFDGPAKRIC